MIIDIECPQCNGEGKVMGVAPSKRALFVSYDDLSPDDYALDCPNCDATGVVEYDPEEEAE